MASFLGHSVCILCVFYRTPCEEVPAGLMHTVVCVGDSAKIVYRSLYHQLKNSGVGPNRRTFVYPMWLREVIRQRFQVSCAHYDEQYENDDAVYQVTETDLLCSRWNDPGACAFCNETPPDTP